MDYLVSAANTIPPIYYLLIEKGFTVRFENEYWEAKNEDCKFIAEDILMLAGLVYLYENRRSEWKIDDDKIDAFLKDKNSHSDIYSCNFLCFPFLWNKIHCKH